MKKLIILCLLFLLTACSNPVDSNFILTYITVDKGDAFILNIDNKYHYMLDTGKEKDFNQIDKILKLKGITRLDGIILTHGHKDHAGSFEKLLDNYKVDKLYISALDNVSYKKIDAIKIAQEHGLEIIKVNKRDEIKLNQTTIKFWIPDKTDLNEENNNSIITYINHKGTNFLMMADAKRYEELEFIKQNKIHNIDVLKLGHHGEDDASSKAFLSNLNFKYAIKTANIKENPESFNNDVDQYLNNLNIKVYDANDDVLAYDFISNTKDIKIKEIK